MTPLFKKLNFKAQPEICVINAPAEFQAELQAMREFTGVKTDLAACDQLAFLITFVSSPAEVEAVLPQFLQKMQEDAILWFAYPKGSSKKYKAQIGRDYGWDSLGEAGFETVRGVAIDDDWSAMRFRRVELIKNMNRSEKLAISAAGKARAKDAGK